MLVCFGASAALWSWLTVPTFSSIAPAKDIAALFAANYRFRIDSLVQLASQLQVAARSIALHPDIARGEAVIGIRLAEEALRRGSLDDVDGTFAVVEQNVRSALRSIPVDSFLWTALYSVRTARYGFDERDIIFLRRSYVAGPHEGWISLGRNRSALAIFQTLDSDMQRNVVTEFSEMVDSGFVEEALDNLKGMGWAHRDVLLASLASVDAGAKEEFARRLVSEGLEAQVPGVQIDERAWRR